MGAFFRRNSFGGFFALFLFFNSSFAHAFLFRCLEALREGQEPQTIALSLIQEGRQQEAIWLLRECGLTEEANVVEAKLIEEIEAGQVTATHSLEGANNSGKVFLNSGISGVFKSPTEGADKEVAIFKLDRLLGSNQVPVTVLKDVNGIQGSFQFWIKKSSTGFNSLNFFRFRKKNNFNFFNLITGNPDGLNLGNILYPRSRRVVNIDNQLSFNFGNVDELPPNLSPFIPSRHIYKKYKALDKKTLWDQVFSGIESGKTDLERFLKRRDLFVDAVEKLIAIKGETTVFPE